MKKTIALSAPFALMATAASAESRDITGKGPQGDLAGTLIPAVNGQPTIP